MSDDEKPFVITLGECPFCGGSVEAEIGVTVHGDSPNVITGTQHTPIAQTIAPSACSTRLTLSGDTPIV